MKLYLDDDSAEALRKLLAANVPIRNEFNILNHWR